MQTRADSHRWSLCGQGLLGSANLALPMNPGLGTYPAQADTMHASVLDAALCIPNAPYHHSNASSGQRSVKLPCHDCPHFQTGVVGQELSHPAFAYRSNLSHTFSTVLSYQSLTCATVHINWQAPRGAVRCFRLARLGKRIPPYKARPSASMPHQMHCTWFMTYLSSHAQPFAQHAHAE